MTRGPGGPEAGAGTGPGGPQRGPGAGEPGGWGSGLLPAARGEARRALSPRCGEWRGSPTCPRRGRKRGGGAQMFQPLAAAAAPAATRIAAPLLRVPPPLAAGPKGGGPLAHSAATRSRLARRSRFGRPSARPCPRGAGASAGGPCPESPAAPAVPGGYAPQESAPAA